MGAELVDEPARLIARIEQTFGRDIDAWLECFSPPYAFVTPEATMVAVNEAEARHRFLPAFEGLKAAGFASSVAEHVSTKYLGDDLALVDAIFTRRHRDGSQMGRMAALYVCRRLDDRWRIAAVIQHPPEHRALAATSS